MNQLKTHCHLVLIYLSLQLQLSCCSALGGGDLFTRYDPDAYKNQVKLNLDDLNRRVTLGNNCVACLVDNDNSSSGNYTTGNIDRRRRYRNERRHYDDPNTCSTYVAPSSIPNAGLGIFTNVPYQKGEQFPFPDVGIVFQGRGRRRSHFEQKSLADQYTWAAQELTHGLHEVGHAEGVIIPGIGTMANCHFGLLNFGRSESWKVQPWLDGTDTSFHSDSLTVDDAGRGSYSPHGRAMFEASRHVEAGEELFLNYGDEWFAKREHLLGPVPRTEHFQEADQLLQLFSSIDRQKLEELGDDYYAYRNANYENMLREASAKDKRLRAALPNDVNDVPIALASGTARFLSTTTPNNFTHSTDFFHESSGACIDGIVAGASTVPQAGKGAFATRSFDEGQKITTTPVITIARDKLQTQYGNRDQVLLNYCYGHPQSSLLFFPYAPSVNFINHGGANASNAELRWSEVPYHKAEWLELSLDDMQNKLEAGLIFDIVATRDIRRGEEILLDYGKDWEKRWDEHVKNSASNEEGGANGHRNLTERLGIPTINEFNQIERHPIVRTKTEEQKHPYPEHVMTRCQFEPPDKCRLYLGSQAASALQMGIEKWKKANYHCQSHWKMTFDAYQLHPCTILARESIDGVDWYSAIVESNTALIDNREKGTAEGTRHLVELLPRYAIRFVERPYAKDEYAHGVFRQAVGLPEGIMPPHWMDLDGDE